MASRIRYEKNESGNRERYDLVSVRNFYSRTTDAMYIVYIDTKTKSYAIKNMISRRLYTGGENINNLHVLKRSVKERLEKLGVNFDKEIRDNTGRVKGVNCSYGEKNEI